jgi:hypothetical protein
MAANGKIAARQVKSRTFARKVGKVLYIIRRVYQTEYNIWKASKKKKQTMVCEKFEGCGKAD